MQKIFDFKIPALRTFLSACLLRVIIEVFWLNGTRAPLQSPSHVFWRWQPPIAQTRLCEVLKNYWKVARELPLLNVLFNISIICLKVALKLVLSRQNILFNEPNLFFVIMAPSNLFLQCVLIETFVLTFLLSWNRSAVLFHVRKMFNCF